MHFTQNTPTPKKKKDEPKGNAWHKPNGRTIRGMHDN